MKKRLRAFAASAAFPAVVGAALFVPLVFSHKLHPTPLNLGLPRVYTGDAPHYLVQINSLVRDGDLYLENNYVSSHQGGLDAGLYDRRTNMIHLTVWYVDGVRIRWDKVFVWRGHPWNQDEAGNPVPTPLPGIDEALLPEHEYAQAFPGLPILLSPFLAPLRETDRLEPAAILCSAVATVLAMLCFRYLAFYFSRDALTVNLVTAVAFLATPLWHYGRALMPASFLTLCLLGAYAFAFRKRSAMVPGLFAMVIVFLKLYALLLMLPLGLWILVRRGFRSALVFAGFVAVGVAAVGAMNAALFGSPLRTSNLLRLAGHPWNLGKLLLDVDQGLLFLCPVVLAAAVAWPALARRYPSESLALLASAIGLILMSGLIRNWSGGLAYGPRYIVPVIPILVLGLLGWKSPDTYKRHAPPPAPPPPTIAKRFRASLRSTALAVLVALSLLISLASIVKPWNSMKTHPFKAVAREFLG